MQWIYEKLFSISVGGILGAKSIGKVLFFLEFGALSLFLWVVV